MISIKQNPRNYPRTKNEIPCQHPFKPLPQKQNNMIFHGFAFKSNKNSPWQQIGPASFVIKYTKHLPIKHKISAFKMDGESITSKQISVYNIILINQFASSITWAEENIKTENYKFEFEDKGAVAFINSFLQGEVDEFKKLKKEFIKNKENFGKMKKQVKLRTLESDKCSCYNKSKLSEEKVEENRQDKEIYFKQSIQEQILLNISLNERDKGSTENDSFEDFKNNQIQELLLLQNSSNEILTKVDLMPNTEFDYNSPKQVINTLHRNQKLNSP